MAAAAKSSAPERTELHRHLDVSLRTSTLLRLAQERGLEPQSTSLDAFRDRFYLRQPLSDLQAVLAQFQLFQRVLDRPEVLEQVAFEAVEDCRAEGTRNVELRFSPSFVCEFSGLRWEEALASFDRGVKRALARYPEMRAGLICIGSRDYGAEEVDRTVEFFLQHRSSLIGLDLAGNEAGFPCRLFESSFRRAAAAGARITVHAGEASGPENIWEAIELLGARRIGHGISCVRDPKLMDHLARSRVCLEMCPTSNWLTQCVPTIASHPLPQVLKAGVPVCINTDDPGIFGVTMGYEINLCKTQMGMSEAEIARCMEHARASSFLFE
jgi:adenosine deaminase